jgi:cytochrome P450
MLELDLKLIDPTVLLIGTASALVALLFSLVAIPKSYGAKNLPPGPAPDFLVGNRNQVPRIKPWRWFKELNDRYGDIVFLRMGRTPTVILGSGQAAWDMLEKRSNITSSRPRFIMGGEILSDNRRGLMMGYTDRWRKWRKVLHGSFNNKASDLYKPIQDLESKQLLQQLLTDPEDYRNHIERYATSVVVSITYGRRVLDIHKDEVVCYNRDSITYLTSVNIPGKYLVETFPALLYLPSFLTPWRTEALKQRQADISYLTGLVEEVKAKMKAGTAQTSFCKQLLEQKEMSEMTDMDIAYACATPFGAGVETTMGTLLCFLLACAKFGDEFLPKARKELDAVVGDDRLPSYDDQQDLPYINAIVAETLRWRPVAVLGGTSHATTEEMDFNGYYIPKGTTVIANLWSIHLNENDFPDPHHFKPERFTEKRDYPGPWGHSAYGWGRRICVGQWLANNSVYLNIARMIWAFDLGPAKDENGKDVAVDIFSFSNGFNSLPTPFPISIKPRSQAHASTIQREFAAAHDDFAAYDSK